MSTSSAIHSNAFNFLSFLLLGVDPRTGQYTVTVDVPELKSNHLCGPTVPLQLQFNPLNELDSGFGMGWNLSLSQYTPHDHMLALSTGENYKVTGSGNQPAIKEKKLDSFHFYDEGNGTYRVVHKPGLVEILVTGGSGDQRVALPREIRSPSGHAVSLTYVPFQGGQLLETVSDAFGTLLRIERAASNQSVTLHMHPDSGPNGEPLASFEMRLNGSGQVEAIILPTAEPASWRFTYEEIRGRTCLTEVHTPVGGSEYIQYRDGGHPYPNPGTARDPLPRVTQHRSVPGFGQPEIIVDYSYTTHNFLGNGASISWLDDGLDNLYRVQTSYEYGSVATLKDGNNSVRSVTRTFNRFHLLTQEVTAQGDCIKTVSTEYHALDVSFDNQPAQFQLPKTVTTGWSLASNPTLIRTEVERTAFDEFGNLIEQTQANGIRETSSYYPKEASPGCPADPEGFVRNLREKTIHPATSDNGSAAVLRTLNTYQALPALSSATGAADWLVVVDETLSSSDDNHLQALQYTERSYYDAPANPALHGRPKSQSETLNQLTTLTEFAYSTPMSRLAGETVDQVVETLTGFDGSLKTITRQHSLLNGEVLLDHDNDSDVQISYVYDVLERVILETVAPDTEFAASRAYVYTLVAEEGLRASQEVVDVKGVTTRTQVDGLNRPVLEERQDADGVAPALYRRTYAAAYDLFGNRVVETDCDWLGTEELALRRIFEFDDWGQQLSVTGPERVTEFSQTDPIGAPTFAGPVTRNWRQGPKGPDGEAVLGGMTETHLTLFEKPARVERFDADGESISVHQYFYDGLGRTAREVDARNATTLYVYDAFDRLVESTLPGDDVVKRSYAEHSDEDLAERISVNDIELGTQRFDGLGRKSQSITGGRLQTYSYDPGQSRPKTVITASGREIAYEYLPALGDEPLLRHLPDDNVTAQYEYDKKNARLLSCLESDQQLERSWFSTGELKSETRSQAGGNPLSMDYVYSLNGRLLAYTDVLGQTQHYRYDTAGRLEATDLGTIFSTFSYNELGWLSLTSTRESGRTVATSLYYDDLGREKQRVFDLNGVSQTLDQTYNAMDAVERRTLTEGATLLRDERYEYDLRGRLDVYTCTGSQPPVDPYGQIISEQLFRFDELDNITRVITTSASGENLARYSYDTSDPTQLRQISNSDTVNYPATIELEYDADGNLTLDEQQRTLTYDALGRLLTVSAAGDAPLAYQYDPLDRVASDGPAGSDQQRFYRAGQLANQVGGSTNRTFMRGADQLLAEAQPANSVLLATDNKYSVTGEAPPGEPPNLIAYSVYGQRSAANPISSASGYNGELSEPGTGWQLLGNGYRAFNPVLMRFHSPDSLSPFGKGGVNGYAYCAGDPVNRADPTGRFFFPAVILAAIAVGAGVSTLWVENKTAKTALYVVAGLAAVAAVGLTMWGIGASTRVASGSSALQSPGRGSHSLFSRARVGSLERATGDRQAAAAARTQNGSARRGRALHPVSIKRGGLESSPTQRWAQVPGRPDLIRPAGAGGRGIRRSDSRNGGDEESIL